MSARQGSASYTIVIGGIMAVLTGAMMLTMVVYPIINAFTTSAFWSASSTPAARVLTFTGGAWTFSGGIVMIAIIMWIWIQTRQ